MLQHQLAQVNAQRSQMAQHAMQLQSAMAQLHSSPPLLNGTSGAAGNGGGASGSPSDSLHTYSGGVSKPAKPPTGHFLSLSLGRFLCMQSRWQPETAALIK